MVDHFVWEGIVWQTVYNDLNRCKNGQSILCDKYLGPHSFWEGKIEETGLPQKRGEATQVKHKNLQGSKNHKHHGDFKFQFVHDLAGADHSKPAIG